MRATVLGDLRGRHRQYDAGAVEDRQLGAANKWGHHRALGAVDSEPLHAILLEQIAPRRDGHAGGLAIDLAFRDCDAQSAANNIVVRARGDVGKGQGDNQVSIRGHADAILRSYRQLLFAGALLQGLGRHAQVDRAVASVDERSFVGFVCGRQGRFNLAADLRIVTILPAGELDGAGAKFDLPVKVVVPFLNIVPASNQRGCMER